MGTGMTYPEAVDLIRIFLRAKDDEELSQQMNLNLPRIDGTFFAALYGSVQQLEREGKPQIAAALEQLGATLLRMRTLI